MRPRWLGMRGFVFIAGGHARGTDVNRRLFVLVARGRDTTADSIVAVVREVILAIPFDGRKGQHAESNFNVL